jgi:hypothetical protein
MRYYANLLLSGLGWGMGQFAITYGVAQNITVSIIAAVGTIGTSIAQQLRAPPPRATKAKAALDTTS